MTVNAELFGVVVHETNMAFLCDFEGDGKNKVWVPKSVVDNDEELGNGYEGTILVAEWFALKEGLI